MKRYSGKEIESFVNKIWFNDDIQKDSMCIFPKISIVTPSFNQGRFLERTILSVLNQHYANIEYIIIDGGSNDESVDIIKKYANHLAYWVSEPDNGQSDALNKGFRKASGDIFFYLASDDILLPGVLHKVAAEFVAHDIDVLFGNRLIIDADDRIVSERRCVKFIPYVNLWGILADAGFPYYPDSGFYRKEMFEKVGGFDISLHNTMDTDLLLKFLVETRKIRFLREYIIGFRIFAGSKTVSNWHTIRNQEFASLLKKYSPRSLPLYFKYPLAIVYIILHMLQGDGGYVFKRIFVEKRKKYHEYLEAGK